jgi:hypothetical protein
VRSSADCLPAFLGIPSGRCPKALPIWSQEPPSALALATDSSSWASISMSSRPEGGTLQRQVRGDLPGATRPGTGGSRSSRSPMGPWSQTPVHNGSRMTCCRKETRLRRGPYSRPPATAAPTTYGPDHPQHRPSDHPASAGPVHVAVFAECLQLAVQRSFVWLPYFVTFRIPFLYERR